MMASFPHAHQQQDQQHNPLKILMQFKANILFALRKFIHISERMESSHNKLLQHKTLVEKIKMFLDNFENEKPQKQTSSSESKFLILRWTN
ncbi:hypothetical protein CEXT_649891 [Caerostris extrusa]|uniref:Uncharacterized protein n=1 Tax=Caerostris extrusa TaxID=172846 RepID=A0AAV4VRD6_CAEEX|nr:hypothetical protein CEXT_649891 [Caerostris extrusa]